MDLEEAEVFDMNRHVEEPEYHPRSHLKIDESSKVSKAIDPKRERYPFCIVWSPLGPLTWCMPFVGHMGICDSRGYIWDFAGPYTIGRDNMAFGNPTRYLKLDPNKAKKRPSGVSPEEVWDDCLHHSNCMYSRRMHNICCDNCHSHVAIALEKMGYGGLSHWNMAMLGAWVFFAGKFPRPALKRFLFSCAPSIIIAIIILLFHYAGKSA